MSKTERVPVVLQGKYDEIAALTDQFCQHYSSRYCCSETVNLVMPNNSYKLYTQAEKLLKGAFYESRSDS